ncbi:MAG: FHA domain-containing protein [Proteobacteria bacterium]|nr:FHA domain-containing protein [Pseudomonadota bacterium]
MAEWHVMLNDRTIDRFSMEEGDTVNIGRGKTADVNLDNVAVSRHHARLEMRNGKYFLTDLRSVNGTFVNGCKITDSVPVTAADRIKIGKFRFVLELASKRVSSPVMPTDFEGTVYVVPKEKRSRITDVQAPRIAVIEGDATPDRLSLKGKETVILGRGVACDLRVHGWLIAKIQCYILARGGEYYLAHRAGWSRTSLNGTKMLEETKLRRGDVIGIGRSKLRFE